MPFYCPATPAETATAFCLNDIKVTRDVHGHVWFQLADENDTDVLVLDFGSEQRNEYVLLNIQKTIGFTDVLRRDYMNVLLAQQFPEQCPEEDVGLCP